MVSQIQVTKNIPDSAFYGAGGTATINIYAEEFTIHTKKSLIKTIQPQAPNKQTSAQSDLGKNFILDLKRIEDVISCRGWLPDESGGTAWNTAWKLRAMCSAGNISGDKGALTSLKIDNLTFSTAPSVFLETVTIKSRPSSSLISANAGTSVARLEINLDFYIGDSK